MFINKPKATGKPKLLSLLSLISLESANHASEGVIGHQVFASHAKLRHRTSLLSLQPLLYILTLVGVATLRRDDRVVEEPQRNRTG